MYEESLASLSHGVKTGVHEHLDTGRDSIRKVCVCIGLILRKFQLLVNTASQMFIGFNNKQMALTSTIVAMATLKEVKDTQFLTF